MNNTAAVSKETWQSRDTVTIQTHSYTPPLSLSLSLSLPAFRLLGLDARTVLSATQK